jgi:hypothetical protein
VLRTDSNADHYFVLFSNAPGFSNVLRSVSIGIADTFRHLVLEVFCYVFAIAPFYHKDHVLVHRRRLHLF